MLRLGRRCRLCRGRRRAWWWWWWWWGLERRVSWLLVVRGWGWRFRADLGGKAFWLEGEASVVGVVVVVVVMVVVGL